MNDDFPRIEHGEFADDANFVPLGYVRTWLEVIGWASLIALPFIVILALYFFGYGRI